MRRALLFRSLAAAVIAAGLIVSFIPAAWVQGVVSDWKAVQPPPAPELKDVKVDPQKTALLVLDFNEAVCTSGGARARPRCIDAVPKVKQVLDEARAHHMLVIFTAFQNMSPIVKELTPRNGEPVLVGHADKFDGTDMDKLLKDHGIITVIATGTAANGAVLFTCYGAASHGYKVVVPVDTMPGATAYAEQSSIWGIAHDPGMGNMTTLTSVDKITF
jgi:nicotinamidase-related amidase